jgi:hypothetical protein
MPTMTQRARLSALENTTPTAVHPMTGMSAIEVRKAVLDLLDQVGTSDSDPLLVWAQNAPDSDMEAFRDGRRPAHASWWIP